MHRLLEGYFNLIKRFLPSKKEGNSVGVDIGTGDCKLIELTKGQEGFRLVNMAIDPMPSGDVEATLKAMFERLENPCRSLYTSISGKGTLIRYIDMPKMSIDELRNSFSIEADKYFPFAQDQIYTDCFILDNQGKGKNMAVMAAASKKELIDERVKILKSLGYAGDFIGVNAVALANVLHMVGLKEEEPKGSAIALLDMGQTVSNLSILVDHLPRFSRDIFVGGRDLSKRISNALGVSEEEAERLKLKPGKKLKDIQSASESAVTSIVQEIRLSFDYFTGEKNCEIDQLLLTGGGSMLEGIAEILEKNLEIKVKQWNPMECIEIPEEMKKDTQENSLKMGVALGLALYDYD